MSLGTAERHITGVGALIVSPETQPKKFLTIRERYTSKITNKLSGMDLLPMETGEVGEQAEDTLGRLFTEEVRISPVIRRLESCLCVCELAPGVFMHAYLYEALPNAEPQIGSRVGEVENIGWTPFVDVLNLPQTSLRFRPGVYETVLSYYDYLENPDRFYSRIFPYNSLRHKVPPQAFKLIERGVSQEEALSQLGLVG